MKALDRRAFLQVSAGLAGKTIAGLTALQALTFRQATAGLRPGSVAAGRGDGGYGELHEVGPGIMLPEGFEHRIIGVQGSIMSDGHPTPGQHDGMGAFALPNGNIRLIRNHEVQNTPAMNAAMGDPMIAYDVAAGGGTVSLEIDPETREVVRDFVSLNGTWRNCAGGATPWGSWLSCEEAFFSEESGFGAAHGYVFEVPAVQETCEFAEPLAAMGRFVHEAVAVDPRTGIVYETEDKFEAGFYRFVPDRPYRGPDDPGDLRLGGILQMLAIDGQPKYDTSRRQRPGRTMSAYWISIPEPNPDGGRDDHAVVFEQGRDLGGAVFSRLEGCFYADGSVYLTATDGGDKKMGQVWQYTPTGADTGQLTLIFESPHRNVLNRPDNICVSPRGAIIICEDGRTSRQYVRGLTPDGTIFNIAANRQRNVELAGATFSPDGRTLFFNSYGDPEGDYPAQTYAVWGPWEKGAV